MIHYPTLLQIFDLLIVDPLMIVDDNNIKTFLKIGSSVDTNAYIITLLTSSPSGQDLLTSRFATGARGVVLAALKQR